MKKPTPELRELFAALHDALDVPIAAVGANHAEGRLLRERVSQVRGFLTFLISGEDDNVSTDVRSLSIAIRICREMTAENPVTYPVSKPDTALPERLRDGGTK